MNILVLNSGSSSLKFKVIDMDKKETVAEGICERIGMDNSVITYKNLDKQLKIKENIDLPTHKEAVSVVLEKISDSNEGVMYSLEEIEGIGHRVAHGGDFYSNSVLVDEQAEENISKLSELAPLHNPANLLGIKICKELMPSKPNVAVFDTAFHQSMPERAYMYALPYEDYSELKIRKYGFHGTSHKYIYNEVKEYMRKENLKVIVCHLGNGASISAIDSGECLDTSMGLTPLQGLMMGTRCGDLDPAAALYIMKKRGISAEEMESRLNKESGLLGIFGKSSDLRDILSGIKGGDKRAQTAFDMFTYRVKTYIGAYSAALGGVDVICFTAGIGENAAAVREGVCSGLEYLGVEFDIEANRKFGEGIQKLSKDRSKVGVFKIPTDEELMIAKDTLEIISVENFR